MDLSMIVAALATMAGAAGGYFGGRQTVNTQSATISALAMRVEDQQRTIDTIPEMQTEINVLRGLVTQRANVEKVIEIVERSEAVLNELVQRASHGGGQ